MLLAIANRPIDTNTTYSTGGDVSRFKRRTVPDRPRPMVAAMGGVGKGLGQAIAGATGSASPSPSGVRVVRGNQVN